MFTVEVVYALLNHQEVIRVQLKSACSIEEVIMKSKIAEKYTEIDINTVKVGIYNQIKKISHIVSAGDRVEIYRELVADPKEVRKKRAEKQRVDGIIK